MYIERLKKKKKENRKCLGLTLEALRTCFRIKRYACGMNSHTEKNISRKWNISVRGNEILQRKGVSLRDPAILEDESAPESRM